MIFSYIKRSSDEQACDAKAPTPFESETDHHVWQGKFFGKAVVHGSTILIKRMIRIFPSFSFRNNE